MQAMVLRDIAPIEASPLRLAEVTDPQPGPGEVRIAEANRALQDLKPDRISGTGVLAVGDAPAAPDADSKKEIPHGKLP